MTSPPSQRQPVELDLHGVEPDTYPAELVEYGGRWLVVQSRDDENVPRDPTRGYADHDVGYAVVDARDPTAWFDYETARDWVDHDDDLGLGYYLTGPDRDDWEDDETYAWIEPDEDVPPEPHVGLLDFNDVCDLASGEVAPAAVDLLEQLSGTFCEWSPSGTGVHALGGFRFPEGVSTITIDLSSPEWPDAALELSPGGRYTPITGDHIPGTATATRDIHGIVDEILATNQAAFNAARATPSADRPD